MILDNIKNCGIYFSLGKRMEQALRFICNTDFSNYKAGKYPIDNVNLFFLVNEYQTRQINDCLLESHKKYYDLQFMFNGKEKIGHSLLKNQIITKTYNSENDYVLYKPENLSFINLFESEFAVFFPDDLHMPGIKINEPENIKKVVVKILI